MSQGIWARLDCKAIVVLAIPTMKFNNSTVSRAVPDL